MWCSDAHDDVALVVPEDTPHRAAQDWFAPGRAFATCPTVQSALLRLLLRQGTGASASRRAVRKAVTAHPLHHQWLDDVADLVPH